ncbi:MAG TPA: EamA family transporter [Nitrososphaeraceae archaeon]|nr:EamA family transporter [Nitrososphaeraceae archaeon]
MHLHSQLTVVLIAILMLSLLWGSSFIAIKIIVDEVQPLASFGMRFFIAGLLLVAAHYILIHTIRRRPYKKAYQNIQIKNRQYWKSWLLAALFFIVGGQGILALGAQYLSSGAAALINSTIPIWVAIFMLLFLGKKPTRLSIAGITAGFIGLIILVLPTLETEESGWIGIVLLIISSISWAVGSLFSTPVHYAGTERGILLPTGMFMALGGLILLVIWAVTTGTNEISTLNTLFSPENNLLVSFLFLTLVCTAVGYAIFYWLLESTTPSLANTFAYIVPVIAVFLGWVILGESINFQTIIATVVISAGVAMMIISPASKKTSN